MKYDVIVIGSGLGGLTAAAKLSKEGKKVLIIEQHYTAGGCATIFKRKGFTFEVALHEMDGFVEGEFIHNCFKELGILQNVELTPIPEFFRLITPNHDAVISHNHEETIKNLCQKFPGEKKGIKKYFKTIKGINKDVERLPKNKWARRLSYVVFPILFPTLTRNMFKTVGEFMDGIIKDINLKLILIANLGYYSDNPYKLSMIYFGIPQWNYMSKVSFYIKGGSQKLSNHLVNIVKEAGGEMILRHEVSRIITNNGMATGVKYHKTGKPADLKEAFADAIVANSSLPDLVDSLLPELKESSFGKKVTTMEIASSFLCVFIGFKKPVKELGNRVYSTFYFQDSIPSIDRIYPEPGKDFQYNGCSFVDYSLIDSGLAPEGKGVGTIVTIDYLANWENLPEEEYKAKKERAAQTLFEMVENFIPGFKEAIEYYEVGTPRTIVRFTKNRAGSVYGFAQTPRQAVPFRPGPTTPVKNLYIASAWGNPGGGFTAVMRSGYLAAMEIMGI